MEIMDKIFEKKERDYSNMRVFFKKNRFYTFYLVVAWKKNKNYNKGKFRFWWGLLRNKSILKVLIELAKIYILVRYNKGSNKYKNLN